jgi:adenylate cyclase class 1
MKIHPRIYVLLLAQRSRSSIIGGLSPEKITRWPKERLIKSLMLMGSIGTIAQSKGSDFDYWVCVDGSRYTPGSINLLQKKLNLIEQWADTQHGMEVHFFISQIDKVCANDFGVADGESYGSSSYFKG